MAELRRDVFQAIADPTRREIIQLLSGGSLNLNAIAENFHLSRPAISQQVKILAECGLIVVKRDGRERFCEVKLQKLKEASDWINKYTVFWTGKLDALEAFLEADEKKHQPKRKTSNQIKHGKSRSKK